MDTVSVEAYVLANADPGTASCKLPVPIVPGVNR